ncbi:MAG TPA: DNA-directed RNA polymerase subunit P [Candidatus Diapherotrites archaeon]|uniref:DNA-directed RNA polymerase subunit Rpo12 n=1 Tax=Candidatus Iainarchaeum sp. TaxID=3101447 RepID=A0A7J4J0N9_9ARCH|nr:DNA-directed RNA polymerase subunit P [Candidatus Diapherotrites archaeon]
MYKCLQCGKEVSSLITGTIRCPGCGFKVFAKTRDPVAKTVKAL